MKKPSINPMRSFRVVTQVPVNQSRPSKTAEPTLDGLLHMMWDARKVMLVMAALTAAAAGLFLGFATPSYKANMIVAPATPMNESGASSLLANDNLFALRHLVQNSGVSNSSHFLRFEHIFYGPSVAAILLEDEIILRGLRADKRFGLLDYDAPWSATGLSEYLRDKVQIRSVSGSSLRRLSYTHPNPQFAAYLLGQVATITDSMIRDTIRTQAEQRITYLRGAVTGISNPEHRKALTTLLLEQERLRMLVSIDQPYAASVVEPAISGDRASWPDPYFLFSAFILAGLISGFVIYGFRRK